MAGEYLKDYFPNTVRQTTALGRAYYDPTDTDPNPFLALSVTTVLGLILNKGKGFDMWLKNNGRFSDWWRDYKAHLGTAVHILCEDLYNGKEVVYADIQDRIQRHLTAQDISEGGGYSSVERTVCLYLESFSQFYADNEMTTWDTELQLFDNRVPYAGTVDWIGELNGEPSILDIKTGTEVDSHELQLVAYGMLHNYLFPKNKVTKLYTLYIKSGYRRKPNYKLSEVSWHLADDWRRIIQLALSLHGKDGQWRFSKRFEPRKTFKLTKTEGAR
jgi:hypothetical protein